MVEAVGPRILVVGCGAIGGVIAGHLLEIGQDVSVLTTNPDIARALSERGVRVRGDAAPAASMKPVAVYQRLDASVAPFDFVLLATQPPQVEEAARSALPSLAAKGRMVCFQNGLSEERVAKLVGAERVIGAVVAWGASMVEPGAYDRTSAGGFSIGRLDGQIDEPLEELARVLEAVGPVTLTQNLLGARWSKLAINCNISTLGTIGGDRLGTLMRQRHVRRLALEVMTEVVAVARAEEIHLEKVSGTLDLDWISLTEAEKTAAGSPGLLAKHTLLLAVGARYRRLRSSMLSAIERGRPPAVDFLNGEIVSRGDKHRIPTPINAAAREMVWAIARGEATASHETLRRLYDETRPK
jgi:2-dehydropantoate 2-reductase